MLACSTREGRASSGHRVFNSPILRVRADCYAHFELDGAPCNDGNPATTNDMCYQGACGVCAYLCALYAAPSAPQADTTRPLLASPRSAQAGQ